jgi:uncharacterized protein
MDSDAQGADLAQRLAVALEPLSAVRLAYLFGSRAHGGARPDSDLDLALKLEAGLDPAQRAELALSLPGILAKELGAIGERVDVLDLDRASSTVVFRAIRDGRCVLCRDARERIRFEATAARRYDDTRPYRELFQRAARAAAERMQRGNLGRP